MRTFSFVLALSLVGTMPVHSATRSDTSPSATLAPMLDRVRTGLRIGQRQPTPDTPALTLDVAVADALERNPTLIVLRRQYEAATYRPARQLALAPPSFEAQIWQWPLSTLNPSRTNMYMFTVGQEIPGRGKRALRAAVEEKEAELSQAAIAVEARVVIDEVKQTYADLFLARREIEIHHANLDLLRQFADLSEAKYMTGRMSQQDTLKAVVELSRLYDHLVGLREREQLAQARLNTWLDRPPESAIGALITPREHLPLPSAAELQRMAIARHPELHAARLGIARAEAVVAAERQENKPDFFIKGGYFLMPRDTDSWTAMAGLTWPRAPWSRKGLDARVAEAEAAVATAHARDRAVENTVRLAVHDAYVRIEAAQERATLLRTSILPQSDQTLEVSRAAYQTDRADFLSVIDNQRILLDAQLDYYRALSDLDRARADLERAVGVDLRPMVTDATAADTRELSER